MFNNSWRCSHLGMARDSTEPTQCNITSVVGVGLSGARGGVRLGKRRQLSQSHCVCSSWLHRSHHPPGGGCVIAGCGASILHGFPEEQTFSFLHPRPCCGFLHCFVDTAWNKEKRRWLLQCRLVCCSTFPLSSQLSPP